jgi:hypothetical protein
MQVLVSMNDQLVDFNQGRFYQRASSKILSHLYLGSLHMPHSIFWKEVEKEKLRVVSGVGCLLLFLFCNQWGSLLTLLIMLTNRRGMKLVCRSEKRTKY